MEKQEINYTEYSWEESKSPAHNYLFRDIKKIFKDFKVTKKATILDMGCGGGYILSELHKLSYKNIWGFDLSTSGINIAKKQFQHLRDRVEVHNVYNVDMPSHFPNDYDLILSIEVIEHLYNPKAYLENIYQKLKFGGLLILSTPYHGYVKNVAIALLNRLDKHVNPLWTGGHIKFFSKKTLFQLFQEAHIKLIKFYGSGRLPFLWKSMIIVGIK